MTESGMDAILIKVAGIGLTTSHLGKHLADMKDTLYKLVSAIEYDKRMIKLIGQNELYGSHICGEGGEYETLTLDSPLFKRRITLYADL